METEALPAGLPSESLAPAPGEARGGWEALRFVEWIPVKGEADTLKSSALLEVALDPRIRASRDGCENGGGLELHAEAIADEPVEIWETEDTLPFLGLYHAVIVIADRL